MSDPLARAAAVMGERARPGVLLGPLTTYRVGGPAALFCEATSDDDLRLAARAVEETGVAVLVIGNGSNLLVADAGFRGLAIHLGAAFAAVEVLPGARVRAGGAASLPVVARRTAAAALTGFEWAVGVPGTIGGAVRMNAGGHGSDMRAVLARCRVVALDGGGAARELPVEELDLAYRQSALRSTDVVVQAELALEPGDRATAEQEIAGIVRWRREHQPGGQNAGSVFTNPEGDSAGRLIDAAGLKGYRRGSAQVSTKHANFIQADEGGSADDVWALIQEVRDHVARATGIDLVPEVRTVGFDAAGRGGRGRSGAGS